MFRGDSLEFGNYFFKHTLVVLVLTVEATLITVMIGYNAYCRLFDSCIAQHSKLFVSINNLEERGHIYFLIYELKNTNKTFNHIYLY